MSFGAGLQDRLLRQLGGSGEGRSALVESMLRRDASESTSYWLQLIVAVGIATMGLVVGSTAVVIGAMLIAPLMGPIVGLAMGLAAGSPYLVLRCAGRLVLSVVVAIAGAAAITAALPYHELNAEIVSRTSPTVLDLITAGFCAIAGAYAALRPSQDTAATAAGTSIGISLAPPLCASGYGIATSAWPIAGGAALLFLTNMVAIVVVGTMVFLAAGFNRVDVVALERTELERAGGGAPISRVLARSMSGIFASRAGPLLRFLMPFALLVAIYIPLRQALDEVAWQVRARAAIHAALADEPHRIVQSRIRVERHAIEVVVVILGRPEDADEARARIDAKIRKASGVVPRLDVAAVPDAIGVDAPLIETAAPLPALTPEQELARAQSRIQTRIRAIWPNRIGEPLSIDVGPEDTGPVRVRVVHLGSSLSADAKEAIEHSLAAGGERPAALLDVAVTPNPITLDEGSLAFIARTATAARTLAPIPGTSVCVTTSTADSGADEAELARALDEAIVIHPHVVRTAGTAWSVHFVLGACPIDTDAGALEPADASEEDWVPDAR
ncbi:hypothetical protein BH09MYX1_BH09MYX1_06760 [soil metagenome]